MSRVSRGFRITGKLLKATALCIIFSIMIFLLWRIFAGGTPKELKSLMPNEALASAYAEKGDDLYIFKQDLQKITTADYNRGYFSITECAIIPEANQIQIVFRYNNSTIRALAEDKNLNEVPSRDEKLFDVSLSVQKDLTPDNKEDNAGNVEGGVEYIRLFPTEEKHAQKRLHNYYRYVFDFSELDLSLSEMIDKGELLAIYADVYYVKEINYEKAPYGTLCLYEYKADIVELKLKSRDKKAIENYGGK